MTTDPWGLDDGPEIDPGPIPPECLPSRAPRSDRLVPVFDDGLVTLYHADALDVIEEAIEPGTLACLLTDPPYGQAFDGKGESAGANLRGDGARGGMRTVRRLLGALEDRWCPRAISFVFCHGESFPDFKDVLDTRLAFRNALIWTKGGGGPGDTSQDFARNFEMIVHSNRGARPLLGSRDGCVLPFKRTGRSRLHPTEKPIPLLRYLLGKAMAAGELAPNGRPAIAFDGFAGSASMLIAARQLGIRAIGAEIDSRWVGPAVERLRQTEIAAVQVPRAAPLTGSLFADVGPPDAVRDPDDVAVPEPEAGGEIAEVGAGPAKGADLANV